MIGLVDYDLQASEKLLTHPPNLEIMKLATYYRVEKHQFCRLIFLDEEELNGYENIYFFSESEDMPRIPQKFLRQSNVIYGGTAFTNGIYQPFTNEIIDFILPKPYIYKEYLKQCFQDGAKEKTIAHILDDSYYRRYAGNNKLPLPPILPHKKLWFYDMNFIQDGWQDWVQEATERKCSSIFTIHPIVCHHLNEYIQVRNFTKIARINEIILDIGIPLSEVHYMFKEYLSFFLEDIVASSSVYLSIGGTYPSNFQYYKDLIYKLNLLYCFWSKKIPIKLRYIPPRAGVNCSIIHLLQAISRWSNSTTTKRTINDTIIKKTSKTQSIEYEEELQLLKFYPTANELFNQKREDIINRGYWRI